MIDYIDLRELCNNYGVNGEKVIDNNPNVLSFGEYMDIERILSYLINEVCINPKSIEKCPSTLSYNVDAIKLNYEFLSSKNFKRTKLENCLHILSADPDELKKTYDYIIKKYGEQYLKINASILNVDLSRIKTIEKNFGKYLDKTLILTAASSRRSFSEIREIIEICNKNNIKINGGLFHRKIDEIKEIIKICEYYNIEISSNIFRKNAEEVKEIIKIYKDNNLDVVIGNLFRRNADEIKEIIEILRENNLEVKGSIFHRKPDEIREIIEICKAHDLEILYSIFRKNIDELKEIIELCNENNINFGGKLFTKTIYEIKEIIRICNENNIEVVSGILKNTSDELKETVKICNNYNIRISKHIFLKSLDDIKDIIEIVQKNNLELTEQFMYICPKLLEENIKYIKENFGEEYLLPQLILKNKKTLMKVLPYLESLGVLSVLINDTCIMTLTYNEIISRKKYIESIGEDMVVDNKFNLIFGLSESNYKDLKDSKKIKSKLI